MSSAVPVPIMLAVTVTPGNVAESHHERICISERARKTFHELDGGYIHGHVRWGLTLQALCRGYRNVESGCHVGEFNRTVVNHHTVDTNFRGDIFTVPQRGGVGQDSAR